MPSNEYYDHTTYPGPNAPGSSAALRAELDSIEQGFLKLPALASNGNKVVVVNAGGTALTTTLSLSGLTLNSTTIGSVTPASGSFTTLSASGAVNLGSSVTIAGGTINGTQIGNTTPSSGAFTTLSASSGLTGNVTGNVTGNLTGNVTASSGTSTFNNLTVNGTLDMASATVGTISGLQTPSASDEAANKGYVDTQRDTRLALAGGTMAGAIAMGSNAITGLPTPSNSADAATKGYVDTQDALKLSLSGGTMSGALAMGSNKITGLGTPTATGDAATKGYADTQDALRLALAGGTMSGAIAMGSNKITGMADPTSNQDAATKFYVDGILGPATSAAASASAAAASEIAAGNSATAASNSASSALTSANNAAASYDSFDDRYLGAKASDPTLDNDGNALLTGAMYWNTVSSIMKVWTGSAWSVTYLPATGYLQLTGGTLTGNLTMNVGTDSRVLLQVSGTTQAQFQATASAIRLASNNTTPLALATNGIDRVTIDSNGVTTFGSASASASYKFQGTNTGDLVILESTDESSSAAPDLVLYRNSASPAAADQLGVIIWRGKDSGAADQQYARIGAELVDPTVGSEDGELWFEAVDAGAAVERFRVTSKGVKLTGNFTEQVFTLTGTALNPANGTIQTTALTGNTSFTDSLSAGQSMVLMMTSGSSYTVTWPTITWVSLAGNVAPVLSAADVLVFWKVSTTLYGAYVGKYA